MRIHGNVATWLVALLVGLWTTTASGTIRRVPTEYPTIGAAIIAAADLDSIVIEPGTYFENLDTGTKQLAFTGLGGASSTIIDGRGLGRVLFLRRAGTLQGLTIQHGAATTGGGVFATGVFPDGMRPLLIKDCVFRENAATIFDVGRGGGLFVGFRVSSAVIRDCQFLNNTAGHAGGGAYLEEEFADVRGNVFRANSASHFGGGVGAEGSYFRRNLFVDNIARDAGGGLYGATAELRENTFARNTHQNTFSLGAGIHLTGGVGDVANNIIWASTSTARPSAGVGLYCNGSDNVLRFSCNDSWGNSGPAFLMATSCDTVGGQNFSADPQFCGPDIENFFVSDTSPCTSTSKPCGMVGAYGIGCTVVATRAATWSQIKSLPRHGR
jgi:hypothetical protein